MRDRLGETVDLRTLGEIGPDYYKHLLDLRTENPRFQGALVTKVELAFKVL